MTIPLKIMTNYAIIFKKAYGDTIMKINISRMSSINETSYLTAENALLYRTIMRILYNEKENFNSQLSTEEIHKKLTEYPEFEDSEIEKVKSAMSQLTSWENVTPMQDPRRVNTIEEYKNKIYKYSLTERSVKIERLTIELENIFSETNTLSSSLLVRIYDSLCRIERIILSKNLKEINEWWKNLQEDFKRLDQNFSDYLHSFYSVSGEKMMTSVDFLLHKDKFVEYLNNFITVLQRNSTAIENSLLRINNTIKADLLKSVILSELDLPRTISEAADTELIEEKINSQWHSLYCWFISENGRESVCSMAMEYTNEIIRKILNNAVMLMQLQNAGISKKLDYKKFMQMFSDCSDVSEAHCLSAHVFGSMSVAHYKFNSSKNTDSIYENAAELPPQEFEIRPRTRTYKPKIKTEGFESRNLQKAALREARIKAIQQEQEMIEAYIRDNKIVISDLSDQTVPEKLRITLLKWIAFANQSPEHSGTTEYGRRYTLTRSSGTAMLHCTDGDLVMPEYILEFEVKSDE